MRVKLPDGKIAEFPDDMDPVQIEAIIRNQFGATEMFNLPPGASLPLETRGLQPGQPTRLTTPAASMASARHAGTMGPIVGDVAGTLLAPQAKGGQMGIKLINQMLKMGGAAAGGFGGSVAGQQRESGAVDLGQAAEQGAWGAASELVFPLLKFGAKGAKLLENITAGGRLIKGVLRDRIEKKAVARARQFIGDNAPDIVKQLDDSGNVARAIDAAFDENKLVYNQFKAGIQAAEDANGEVYLADTVNYLNQKLSAHAGKTTAKAEAAVMRELGYTGNVRKLIKKVMAGDPLSADDVQWLFYNYNPKTAAKYETGLLPSTKAARIELKDVLLDDIDRLAGGTGAAKRTADAVHGALKEYEALRKIFVKNIVETDKGINFYPGRLGRDLRKQKARISAKDPQLWANVEREADHYLAVAKKLKQTRVEKMPGMGISGAGMGYIVLGKQGAVTAELLGTLAALGTMSDAMAKTLGLTGRAGLKGALHTFGPAASDMLLPPSLPPTGTPLP